MPRTSAGLLLGLMRETFTQAMHSMLPHLAHQESSTSTRDLIIEVLAQLSFTGLFQNSLRLFWSHLAGINRAEQVPPSPGLAFSYAQQGCFASMLGWQSRAARYGDQALAMAREFDDVHLLGESWLYPGIGLYAAARYDESLAHLIEAIAAHEKAGDFRDLHIAHFHKGCCHFGLGNLAETIAESRWTFASSARIGDSRTMCSAWLWARATRGNIPFEELKSCIPCRPDDVMSTVHATLAEGYWHSYHGRTAEALQVYKRAADMVRKSLCVNSHTVLVMPMLAMGLRLHADAIQARDGQQAEQLRKRAYRVAKWATRLTWLFPAAYPLALRERALILAAWGKTKKALKFADRSCAVAETQKAKYEHAQSLLVRGQLAKELGLPEADEQIRTAEAALEAIERPIRALATPPAAAPSEAATITFPPQPSTTTVEPAASPPARSRRNLGRKLLGGLVALGVAVLLGHLLGRCTGYVGGFVTGRVAGDLPDCMAAGTSLGATVGRFAFPLILLVGWVLVRWGQRHHEAEIRRKPIERPLPPPTVVRHGLALVLGLLVLSLGMIPVALGVWLGGAIGGGGLALTLLLWLRSRRPG